MQTINCYEVLGNSDTTEGRGPMMVVARFSNEPAARAFVKSPTYAKWCVMGYQNTEYDLKNIRKMTMHILDSYVEFNDMQVQEDRARALAKLTPAERKLLGI